VAGFFLRAGPDDACLALVQMNDDDVGSGTVKTPGQSLQLVECFISFGLSADTPRLAA